MAAAQAAAFSYEPHLSDSFSFFAAPSPISLGELARLIDCELHRGEHADMQISTVAPIESAHEGSLTFFNNPRYVAAVREAKAGAVICAPKHAGLLEGKTGILLADDPYKAFSRAMALLFPAAMRPLPISAERAISPAASVDPAAVLESDVTIECGAVVGAGASIGKGSRLGPGAIIGPNVQIGRDVTVSGHASVVHAIVGDRVIIHCGARIGCDGFGFAMGPGGHLKIPQVGRVIIQDDVEIGANTCIDRGANRDTMVGEGTKIDSMVMIGHNNVIGRHCIISGQVGIAGSTELGDYVVLGGKVAVNGHIKIGSGAQIAGNSAVYESVEPGQQLGGSPARPLKLWMRDHVKIRREAKKQMKSKGENADE